MARILCIEDDSDTQHLIGTALFREGYEVHYAWNGEEGYQKILSLDPDLLLLDLMLPVMNGIELMKKIQSEKALQAIPIIVVSEFGDNANMLGHSVVALGASEYLRKPVQLPELISRVRSVLAQYPRATRRQTGQTRELRKGAVRADPKYRTVWIHDRLVATIPYKRFALLRKLIETPGPVSREDLLSYLGYTSDQINALEKAIQRLREDFGPKESCRIQTPPQGYELIG